MKLTMPWDTIVTIATVVCGKEGNEAERIVKDKMDNVIASLKPSSAKTTLNSNGQEKISLKVKGDVEEKLVNKGWERSGICWVYSEIRIEDSSATISPPSISDLADKLSREFLWLDKDLENYPEDGIYNVVWYVGVDPAK